MSEPFNYCLACGRLANAHRGVCRDCKVPYQRAWCAGERVESLHVLIEQYKFYRAKSAYEPLAELLDATLPELPTNTVIIPIPTLRSHARQRGYDHMALIARELSVRRNLQTRPLLQRVTTTKQLGAGRALRIKQASIAFRCDTPLDASRPYLIIDDVVTTGATLKYAAKALKSAGAQTILVASVSRQSLTTNS